MKIIPKNKKGITLIALVVTIVVLIILAGISIGVLGGEDGLIEQAKKAKEETEISEEKELLGRATVQAAGKDVYGNIEEEALQKELDKEAGEGKAEVTDIGEEFEVIFKEKDRYYIVDKDGNIGNAQEIIDDKNPGDITKDKDGNELDGSEEKPYEIWCIEDLVVFSNMVNGEGIKFENGNSVSINTTDDFSGKYIKLMRSLNFKSKLSYANSERTDFGDINGNSSDGNTLINEMTTGTGFNPIGYKYANFNGYFEGKENSIDNIYINKEGGTALFVAKKSCSVKNLEISGNIKSTNDCASGIIAIPIYVETTVIIENCVNRATIQGNNMVGGICSNLEKGEIINCKNYGKIEIGSDGAKYGGAGGIVGHIQKGGIVKNCTNYGDISGNYTMGGIVGCVNTGNIENCINKGNINKKGTSWVNYVGGILGFHFASDNCEIKNCGNEGTILTNLSYNVGGIIGNNTGNYLYIKNCYNIGNIKNEGSSNLQGGIIGSTSKALKIENVYNIGTIQGTATIGGIIGNISLDILNENNWIKNAYYINDNIIGNKRSEIVIENSEKKTLSQIKSNDMVNILNNYIDQNPETMSGCKYWKIGEDGYPVFED